MAAAATHIVLANKVFNKFFSDQDKKEFFIGTSFPDIRYLGVIDRNKTHYDISKITDITDQDSFSKGLKFHCMVDLVREEYMTKNNYYSLFPESPFVTQGAKFFEDIVLFSKLRGWSEIVGFFDNVSQGEISYDISEADIKKWHSILERYFLATPSIYSGREFMKGLGREEMASGMIKVVEGVKDKDKAIKLINDFYNQFETLI